MLFQLELLLFTTTAHRIVTWEDKQILQFQQLNNLQVTTTNQGAETSTVWTYAAFDDVLFSNSGFTFSISNGNLIATI